MPGMLAFALFIGAQLAELPAPPPPNAHLPVHRFVAGGGLGEHIFFHLPLQEPAPTPSIRLIITAGGRSVEIEGRASGHGSGIQVVNIERRQLGALKAFDGVLTARGHVEDGQGGWHSTPPVRVRSQAIAWADANPVERMASLRAGTPRKTVRRLLGKPGLVADRHDWYDSHRLVFDPTDRFVRWDPLGC